MRGRAMQAGMAIAAALAACGAIPGRAQTPGTLTSATLTVQQAFDAGQALLDNHKPGEAEAIFAALEARLLASPRKPERSLAVARLSHSYALVGVGEDARARALLVEVLPVLAAPADGELRRAALVTLGEIEERALELSAAAEHYRAALALVPASEGLERIADRMRLGRAGLFDDPAAIAADLGANLPDARRVLATDKRALGRYLALQGRALLNARQIKPARAAFKEALALSGGLTERVSITDLGLRGDAALAAELDGDHGEAARLTAYTGAGKDEGVSLRLPPDLDPPPCGGEIAPEDMAVVQFGLGDDGHVFGAIPIYASRSGQSAVTFARAVADWSWSPEAAKSIKPFFRIAARLELRCTTRADRISVVDLIKPDVRGWFAANGAEADPSPLPGAKGTATIRDAVVRAERAAGAKSPGLVQLLVQLADRPDVDRVEARALLDRAVTIANAANAPPLVRAWLGAREAVVSADIESRGSRRWTVRFRKVDPAVFGNDPRATAWLRLGEAEELAGSRKLAEAATLLGTVIATATTALPADDPIRRAAAIRLASLQTALGDRAAAAVTFAQSGVDPGQCALLDRTPLLLRRVASSSDYPDTALRLGFDGWAVTEFDVTADGQTRNARAVIVYPPLLFGKSAATISARSVYRPSFRPDGALSCGGYRDRVRFVTGFQG